MKLKISMSLVIIASLLAILDQPVEATVTYSFYCITNNNPVDAGIGSYLFVDVTEPVPGDNQVLFTFRNTSPIASSICDVYFDDGALFKIASIEDPHTGVSFSQLANPGELPGRNNISPPFETSDGFSADSNPPVQPMGVNPDYVNPVDNETLGILFELYEGKTYNNVLNDLSSETIRIGIHVQGYDSGGSESFVNIPPPVIPTPSALLLGSMGIGLVGWWRRRRTV